MKVYYESKLTCTHTHTQPLLVDAHTHIYTCKAFFLFASLNFDFFLLFCLLFAQQRSSCAAVSFKKFKVASQSPLSLTLRNGVRSQTLTLLHTHTHTHPYTETLWRRAARRKKILREQAAEKKETNSAAQKIKIVCKKE